MSKYAISVFDVKSYERSFYQNKSYEYRFYEARLNPETAILAKGSEVVLAFVNDEISSKTLGVLSQGGTKLICLRCAGFNNVDLDAAARFGIKICRVPGYSPESVAEFTLLQIMCLLRKIHRAYLRTKEFNFSLEGLVGETLSEKTIAIVGTGKIGASLIKILDGFNAEILAVDNSPNLGLQKSRNLKYVSFEEAIEKCDILSLNIPLTPETRHIVNSNSLSKMKDSALIVNTGRGGLIDTQALIDALKNRKIGGAALDVYEEEEKYFFQDLSEEVIDDDQFARLMSFPNVIVTSHQAYLTDTSLQQIARTTLTSIAEFYAGKPLSQEVS